jgi:8-oxo-dGTP diphosphatase
MDTDYGHETQARNTWATAPERAGSDFSWEPSLSVSLDKGWIWMVRRFPGCDDLMEARVMGEKSAKARSPRGEREKPDEVTRGKHITVAVGAVIRDEHQRILLVRHRPERSGYWEGKWICPGGELEFGEMIQEGIIREVREETNLEITLTESLPPFQRVARSAEKPFLHVIYVDYLAEMKGGTLKTGGDVGEALWFTAEEIYQRWEELHDDTKRLLSLAKIL